MRFIILIIVLAAFTAPMAHAQGMFLADGQNGFGLSGTYGSGDGFDAYGGSVGFSTRASFDFGLGYTKTDFDTGVAANVEATEWTPFLSLSLLRPNETSPAGVEFRGSYSIGKITTDNPRLQDIDTSVITLGGAAYVKLQSSESFAFQPDFAIYYAAVSAKAEGSSASNTEGEIIMTIRLHGVLGREGGSKVVVSPGLQVADGDMAWTLGVGLVATGNMKKQTGWGSG